MVVLVILRHVKSIVPGLAVVWDEEDVRKIRGADTEVEGDVTALSRGRREGLMQCKFGAGALDVKGYEVALEHRLEGDDKPVSGRGVPAEHRNVAEASIGERKLKTTDDVRVLSESVKEIPLVERTSVLQYQAVHSVQSPNLKWVKSCLSRREHV